MKNKELQRVRMTKYFLDAALEVIQKEGVEQLSARKVADVAGYSYATLYNYFDDMNELAWQMVSVMTHDLIRYLNNIDVADLNGKDRLSKLTYAYADYYLKNPRVFEFLFLHPIGEIPLKVKENLRSSMVRGFVGDSIQVSVDEGKVDPLIKADLTDTVVSCIHGTLMLYFSKKVNITTGELHKRFDNMFNLLMS